jgi:PHD/YefM family antitoxin component YafN of YafNO toxin-antitoxin module
LLLRTQSGTLVRERFPLDNNTNSRDFRTKLSEYFDRALKKPIAISRGTDRFVLMSEKEYLDLKDEVMSLQRNLLSVLDLRSEKTETFTDVDEHFSTVFDKSKAKTKGKTKKVVG